MWGDIRFLILRGKRELYMLLHTQAHMQSLDLWIPDRKESLTVLKIGLCSLSLERYSA